MRLKAEVDSKTQELAAKDERCRKLEKVVVELRKRLNAATEVARKLSSQQYSRSSRASTSTSRRGSDAFSSTILSASSPAVSIPSPTLKMDLPVSPPNYDGDQPMSNAATISHPPPLNRVYSSSTVTQHSNHPEYQAASASYMQYNHMQTRELEIQQQRYGISASIEVSSIPPQGCGNNGIKVSSNKSSSNDDFVPCGFCSGMESICVCRSIEENDKTLPDTSLAYFNKSSQGIQLFQPQSGIDSIVNAAKHQEAVSQSILENLPAPEAAVPLRRRRPRGPGARSTSRTPIFAVQPLNLEHPASRSQDLVSSGANATSGIYTSASGFESGVVAMMKDKENGLYIPPAECSGDPRNCPACKDDDFGTFCVRQVPVLTLMWRFNSTHDRP